MLRRSFFKAIGVALATLAAAYVPGKPWETQGGLKWEAGCLQVDRATLRITRLTVNGKEQIFDPPVRLSENDCLYLVARDGMYTLERRLR